MPVPVTCGACGKAFSVPDEWAGRTGKCPGCGAALTVPVAPPPAFAAAPPPSAGFAPQGFGAVQRPRPGGLTALAVLNFVFAGLGFIGLFALFALLSVADHALQQVSEGQHRLSEAPGAGSVYLMLLLGVASSVLLLVSGIGYIQQKRMLGKTLGNAYGILGVASTVISMALLGAVGAMSILGLAYPVITLALLNSVFKNDFPN